MTNKQLKCLIDINIDMSNDLFYYEDSIKYISKELKKKHKALINDALERDSWKLTRENYRFEARKLRKRIKILNEIIDKERNKVTNQKIIDKEKIV